jgi:hypothetical protein
MNKKEMEQHVKKICDLHEKLGELFGRLESVLGQINGPLDDAVWGTFQVALEATASLIGDNCGSVNKLNESWLEWFVYDNDCGKRGLAAGYGKKLRPVETPKQLVKLILEGRKRNED